MNRVLSGIKYGAPITIGVFPVGIAFAILARECGCSTLEIILLSGLVFAGASQIMAVGMLAQGAAIPVIIIATFLLNLRHLIMSSYVMSKLKDTKIGMKMLLAFSITDESFVLFSATEEEDKSALFLLGLNSVIYVSWVVATILGCLASDALPPLVSDSLGIAFYAAFIGILIPNIKKNLRIGVLVITTVIINTLLSKVLPSSIAIILSTLLGAGIGMQFIKEESKEEVEEELKKEVKEKVEEEF